MRIIHGRRKPIYHLQRSW